jgi:hypothetical protein
LAEEAVFEMSELEQEMQKYKELYDYSREVFFEELSRSKLVDDKASKYITALSATIGLYTLFGKWISAGVFPPGESSVRWVCAITLILLFSALFVSLAVSILALKVRELRKMPLDEETIAYFEKNELISIYYAIAERTSEAHAVNIAITNRKVRFLTWAERLILLSAILLAVLLATLGMSHY